MNPARLNLPESIAKFIKVIDTTCRTHEVDIFWGKGKRVRFNHIACNGYFETLNFPSPRFAVATGKPLSEWLPVAAHEFGHLNQWAENAPAWTDQMYSSTEYAFDRLLEWCDGKLLLDERELKQLILQPAREVERDCEKRTLEMIAQFQLPLDPVVYAQKANSYIFFYTAMLDTRKWYVRAPYEVTEIWSSMPKKILSSEKYDKLPDKYLNLVQKYCY